MTADRDELRRRFLAEAATAFDLMFPPEGPDDLVTFDQREHRAHDLSQQLAVALLPPAPLPSACPHDPPPPPPGGAPPPAAPPPSPRCNGRGGRLPGPGEPLPQRRLAAGDGDVVLRRARYRCTACRVVFFPPR